MQESFQFMADMYRVVIQEQLFLQDLGVSFDYTDSIDNMTRRDLVEFAKDWRDLKRKNSQ